MKKYKVEWNAGDGGFRLYEVLREIEELKDYDCAFVDDHGFVCVNVLAYDKDEALLKGMGQICDWLLNQRDRAMAARCDILKEILK